MSASLVGSEMCIRDRHWPSTGHARGIRLHPALPCMCIALLWASTRILCNCLLYTSDAADDM
eukprot:8668517-Alexandrium_andersonii.AAC.1